MRSFMLLILALVVGGFATSSFAADKLKVLILDGQDKYHDWNKTTPLLKRFLEESGRFRVDVLTSPAVGQDMSQFVPKCADYDVIVSSYNGDPWPQAARDAFQAFVSGGGGFVVVHGANNPFPDWPEYNLMCGLGGWNGRDEKSGPYVYLQHGKIVRDESPGPGGHHGEQYEYVVNTRLAEHPIMQGLPAAWMHTKDELYDKLRGPAENMEVLATAYADPKLGGSGREEPILMTITYGQGRVFHTVLGHADYSVKCVGFVTTLLRGAEWAATGKVTLPVPDDFPTAEKSAPIE
jgi:type 1 glutamine amidotransferase